MYFRQFSSVAFNSVWPHDCSTPDFPVHHQLLELVQTHVCWVGDAIQPSHPLSSLLLHSILCSMRVFSNESALHIRWPKYWSFSISISFSNEHSGLNSFRIWLVWSPWCPGTLKSLFQHHSLKVSILWCSALLSSSHSYTWLLEKLALTIRTFVGKVMSLLFNMMSRFVIAFLPRSELHGYNHHPQ